MELSIFSTQELQALLQLNQAKIDSLSQEISTALNYMAKGHEEEIKRLTNTLDTACSVQAKTKKELAQRSIKTKFNKIKTIQEAAGLLAQAQATQEKIKKQFHHIEGLGKLSRKIKRFQFQRSL